jgi:hypothetical protein
MNSITVKPFILHILSVSFELFKILVCISIIYIFPKEGEGSLSLLNDSVVQNALGESKSFLIITSASLKYYILEDYLLNIDPFFVLQQTNHG